MKLHEYQAKKLLRLYGIPTPAGGVAASVEEARGEAVRLGKYPLVLKAQVHAGGRGRAGGVRVVCSEEELNDAAGKMLSMQLVTGQTGSHGVRVGSLLIEEGVEIARELYLALLVDRGSATIRIMASGRGGMNIEEVAAEEPEAIRSVSVNPLLGLKPHHCRELAGAFVLDSAGEALLVELLTRLYELFVASDCLLLEINPLVVTRTGKLLALDAKMEVDDNALFRQQEIAAWRDDAESDPLELQARASGLNYIKLSGGTVGSMVNGAGLAMATMDLIKQAGMSPANFLDVGGGAGSAAIENGFRILLADPEVRVVFINIFGGILRCDILARGIAEAAANMKIVVPLVVRMAGTNAAEGREILARSGLDLIAVADLAEATARLSELGGAQ